MGNSDWQFVQKILDLTQGHSNAERAGMIVAVLGQLIRRRRADQEYVNQVSAPLVEEATSELRLEVNPGSPEEEPAWLLALGKAVPSVAL